MFDVTTLGLSKENAAVCMEFPSESCACYCHIVRRHDKLIVVLLEGYSACGYLPACAEVGESDACPVKSARRMAVTFASRLRSCGNFRGKNRRK